MHFDTSTRQRWMRVLAHSQPAALAARMNALGLTRGKACGAVSFQRGNKGFH